MSPAPLPVRFACDPLLRGCMDPKAWLAWLARCEEGRRLDFLPEDLLAAVGDSFSSGSIAAP